MDIQLNFNVLNRIRNVPLVAKVMKGTEDFRITSKSFIQCRNETFVYDKVIPYLKDFITLRQASIDADQWTPKIYHLFYGKIPEVSDIDESLLIMENLSSRGFKGGPRLQLDVKHLALMVEKIAQYHAVQFAMRIEGDPMLDTLKSGITALPWKTDKPVDNVYEYIFGAAFERMFDYLDQHPEMYTTEKMRHEVGELRNRFGKDPVSFLEYFRVEDKPFTVIQHGDYNRNNVLFQYSRENPELPVDVRMIDFQEVRYASASFDLFFFLYMSTTAESRERHWDELIGLYHNCIWRHLKDLLNCQTDQDERLQQYSVENFQRHVARYAFYGTMVTIHFLPWMDAGEEELEPLANEFTHNMKSEKCKQLLLNVGGDASNKKVAEALQHACSRGYLEFIKDL